MNKTTTLEDLKKIWHDRDLKEIAADVAKPRIAAVNQWATPSDIKPLKDPLYLSIGIPDTGSLPRKELNEAMQKVMNSPEDTSLRYGFGMGYYPIRKHLADRYTKERGVEVTEDWFLLFNGSTQAIDTIGRAILNPGDVIISESPSYMGSLSNFRGLGAEVQAVPMDKEGMDVKKLKETINALKKKDKRVKMIYTISSFHNPTGINMSSERKRELLQLAAEEDCLILDDAAYNDLYYDEPNSDTLSGLSNGYGVITCGSFSKIVATGLRIGWIHAHPDLISMFLSMRFDMGQNQMALHMMGNFLRAGYLEPHVEKMRALYKKKMNIIADAMDHYTKDYISFNRPSGGFYLWCKLVEGLSTDNVWRAATREGVAINPGYSFIPETDDRPGEFLRVAFCWTPIEQLEEAARRLGTACRRVAEGDTA